MEHIQEIRQLCPFLGRMPLEQAQVLLEMFSEEELSQAHVNLDPALQDSAQVAVSRLTQESSVDRSFINLETSDRQLAVEIKQPHMELHVPASTQESTQLLSRQGTLVPIQEIENIVSEVGQTRRKITETIEQEELVPMLKSSVEAVEGRQTLMEEQHRTAAIELPDSEAKAKQADTPNIVSVPVSAAAEIKVYGVGSSVLQPIEALLDDSPAEVAYETKSSSYMDAHATEANVAEVIYDKDFTAFVSDLDVLFAQETQAFSTDEPTEAQLIFTTLDAPEASVELTEEPAFESVLLRLAENIYSSPETDTSGQDALEVKQTIEAIQEILEVQDKPELTSELLARVVELLTLLRQPEPEKLLKHYAETHTTEEFVELLNTILPDLTKLIDYQQHLLLALSHAMSRSNRRQTVAELVNKLLFVPEEQLVNIAA